MQGSLRRPAALLLVAALGLGAASGCSPDAPAPTPVASSSSTAGTALPPPATTPVPPPEPGSVDSTVSGRPLTRRDPVGLDRTGQAADGVQVTLASVKAIEAKAQGPGEVSGPAVALTVVVDNTTAEPVDLAGLTVTLTDSAKAPGSAMSGPPAAAPPASVAPGETASGVFVFTVPKKRRDPVVVEVSVSATMPLVVFRGTPS